MLYIPTRIFFGTGALSKAQSHITKLGKKALIVCGKTSAQKSGVMADIMPLLAKNGISHHVYAKVSENPTTDMVMEGKEEYGTHLCDFIIGIGGGSPMDAAKAISLAAANNLAKHQLYDANLQQRAVPIVAIPTTHGTGSEVTPYSVLTDLASHKKAGFGSELIFPRIAVINPQYMLSQSYEVSLHTSIDALSHLLEGIYSTQRNPLLYPMIFRGIRLIMDNLSLCLKTPRHLPYREALALAATYGGIAIAHTSTTLQHAIGYPFTTEYGISHGLVNGMFMEAIMRFYAEALQDEFDQLFAALDLSMQEFFEWLEGFPIKIQLEVTDCQLKSWIPQILAARNTIISPRKPTEDQLFKLLKSVQKG